MKNHAFTLIELLVVIAIIAILAAILFPVFAQAKLQAKKSVSISNYKQIDMASILYQNDYDDTYPLAFGNDPTQWGWDYSDVQDFPYNWISSQPGWTRYAAMSWPTLLLAYTKSSDVFKDPAQVVSPVDTSWGVGLAPSGIAPGAVNPTFNGLLASYPATGVTAPSQLPTFWPGFGAQSLNGYSLSDPQLVCTDTTQPCTYVPSAPNCLQAASTQNGAVSLLLDSRDYTGVGLTCWMYGKGWNWSFADGHAKWRPAGMTAYPGNTDYRTDPYTMYNSKGDAWASYQDQYDCHALLFRPDFDFVNFGTPVVGESQYPFQP